MNTFKKVFTSLMVFVLFFGGEFGLVGTTFATGIVSDTSQAFDGLTWSPDRTSPTGGYTVDANTLTMNISGSLASSTQFYKTEGLQATLPSGFNGIKATLKIDPNWATLTTVRAGLWGVFSAGAADVAWPIIEFTNIGGSPVIRTYDTMVSGTWSTGSVSVNYGDSVDLTVIQNPFDNMFEFYINGTKLAHTYSSLDGSDNYNVLKGVIFNSYNGGEDYSVEWSDLNLESVSLPPKIVSTVVVTPTNLQGWTDSSLTAGTATFEDDATALTGTGSLKLVTTSDNNDKAGLNSPALDIELSTLESLSYKTNQISAADVTNGNATIRVWLDLDGDGVLDDQLMFEPYYNGFNGNTMTSWQTWTITPSAGKFWSNYAKPYNGLGGVGGGGGYATNFTIADVLATYPSAKIIGISVTMGTWNPSQTVLADAINIVTNTHDTTYDFESVPLTYTTATTVVRTADLSPTAWFLYNDETDAIDNTLGSFVSGPATAPAGNGSIQMVVTGTERKNLATYQFASTKLANITTLQFSTYSHTSTHTNAAPYLQFNVDFDGSNTWQGRLVYVPANNGTVTPNTWQTWDAIDNGNATWQCSNATCIAKLGATTKTWNEIKSAFPNVALRTTDAFLGIRVGEPYANGFTGNIDKFVIGIQSGYTVNTTTFDFETTVSAPSSGGGGGGGSSGSSGNSGSSSNNSSSGSNTGSNNNEDVTLSGEVEELLTSDKCSIEGSNHTKEENNAYLWACEQDITTMRTIQLARLNSPITRGELAKMMSQYATKQLGKTPDTNKDCSAFAASIAHHSQELKDFMLMSCQLNIMGIKPDTTPLTNFRADDYVTRAEFATVMSRLLRGTEYENNIPETYYAGHLQALKDNNIINNTNPTVVELRAWIMLILHRSSQTK